MRNWFSRFSKKPKPIAPYEEAVAKSAIPAGVPSTKPLVSRILQTVGLITVGIVIGVGALKFLPSFTPTDIAQPTSTLEPTRTPLPTVTKAPTQTKIPQPTPTNAPPIISVETALQLQSLLTFFVPCELGISSMALAPDNQTFAVGCPDGNIHVVRPFNNSFELTIPGYSPTSLLFSDDGKVIISANTNNTLVAWDSLSGEKIYERTPGAFLYKLKLSPDGKLFSAICGDSSVRTFRTRDGELLHTMYVSALGINDTAYSPDSRFLAGSQNDNNIYVWRVDNGMQDFSFQVETRGCAVAYSPDSNQIAVGLYYGAPVISIFDIPSSKVSTRLDEGAGTVERLIYTAAGDLLIATTTNKTVLLWDVANAQLVQTLEGHTGQINSLVLSSDGRFIATASSDGTIRIWGIP